MGITATDQSGLSDATIYYFKVDAVEYNITTGVSPTYEDVSALVDVALDGAGFGSKIVGTIPNQDIRVYNDDVRGSGSTCSLSNGTTSPDLFVNLSFWSRFRKPTVYGTLPASQAFVLERTMSGSMSFGGAAITKFDDNTVTTYNDTYYSDSYYNSDD